MLETGKRRTGSPRSAAVAAQGIHWEVIKHHEVKHGRWVAERSFARAAHFRRLAVMLAGCQLLAFATLMLKPPLQQEFVTVSSLQ